MILAKFDISPAKDKDRKDIMPKIEFSTGITRYDLKFLRAYNYVIMARLPTSSIYEADTLNSF